MVCQFVVICRQAALGSSEAVPLLHRAVRTDIKKVNLDFFLEGGMHVGWMRGICSGVRVLCVTAHEHPPSLSPKSAGANVWSALGSTKA